MGLCEGAEILLDHAYFGFFDSISKEIIVTNNFLFEVIDAKQKIFFVILFSWLTDENIYFTLSLL